MAKKKPKKLDPKTIRARTGLSQVKFAQHYGIPRRTLEDWEAGVGRPGEYVLALLDRAVREDFPEEG